MRAEAMPPPAAAGTFASITSRPWWPVAKKTVGIAFVVFLLALLGNLARQFDWPLALQTLRALPATTLLTAGAIAAVSYLVFASYDLVGWQQTRHGLAWWRVLGVAFVSYAFNLNVGTLVGGIALRARLYAQRGLAADEIARVLTLSIVSNWLGYFFLAGLVLVVSPPPLPAAWGVADGWLNGAGCVLLGATLAWLGMCFAMPGRTWRWREWSFIVPTGPVALLQLAQGSLNWLLVAACAWTLLQQKVGYLDVLSTLLVSAIAGIMAHIPGGLGVLEGTFIALLGDRLPQHELLASLLAYRAIYYLLPLAVAGLTLVFMETRARRDPAASSGST